MLIASILMVSMAPVSTANVDTTRAAFTKCLREDMKKSLEAKMVEAEYAMAQKTVCSDQRDAFRAALIAFDRASGDSQKNAEENADMQIEDYHANFTDKFNDYSSSSTMPAE